MGFIALDYELSWLAVMMAIIQAKCPLIISCPSIAVLPLLLLLLVNKSIKMSRWGRTTGH